MLGKYILDSLVLDDDVRGLVVSSDVKVCNVLRPDVGVEIGAVVVMSTDVRFDGAADVDSNVDVDIETGVVVFSDAEVDVCEGELDSDVEADDGANVVLGAEVQDEVRVKVVLKVKLMYWSLHDNH